MCLGKLKLHTKFEVANCSCCRNIKGEPQNFRELTQPMTTPTFSSVWNFWMGLGKAHQPANLKVAIFSIVEIVKGNPKFWEAPLAQATPTFFILFRCNFMMGLGKPKLHTKFEVASFSHCKNIKGNSKILGSSLHQENRH